MAVSLVSTGVQFPDSSIQTTAAGASPATLVASYEFSGQTSFSLALDYATYPGGYQLIWSGVYPNSSGGAYLVEYSTNNGSSYAAFSSLSRSIEINSATYSNNVNNSGYFAYISGTGYAGTVGLSLNMWLPRAKGSSSYNYGIGIYYTGFNAGGSFVALVGDTYYVTSSNTTFTNVRFSPTAGNWASGTVRILGYK